MAELEPIGRAHGLAERLAWCGPTGFCHQFTRSEVMRLKHKRQVRIGAMLVQHS